MLLGKRIHSLTGNKSVEGANSDRRTPLCELRNRTSNLYLRPCGKRPASVHLHLFSALKTLNPEEPKPSETAPAVPHPRGRSTAWIALLQIILLFLVAVVATQAMWAPALLGGHSSWMDLARIVEFDAAIRAGDYFPLWAPDLYSGYGSPIFQFYAPLAYYATEVPVLLGLDYPSALKVTQLVALFASGLAMYRLASTHFLGWAACVGAVFYMVAPYRLVDMYIRHALAEHFAFVWLPLIVWGTERVVARRSRAGFAVGALSVAALVLTHNIMALIGMPVCIATGWIIASPKRGIASLAVAAGVAACGVGLAAFFWWPAMSGRALTQAEASLTGGYFDFHQHFVSLRHFLALDWNFGISGGQPGHDMPLQIGWLHLLAAFGAMVMVFRGLDGKGDAGRERAQWCLMGIFIMSVATFMCTRSSQTLWEYLPLVKYVQFPWRFLGLVVLGAALCATAVAARLGASGTRAAVMSSVVGITLVMAVYYPYYSQAQFLVGDGRTNTLVSVPAAGVDALQAAGYLMPLGQKTTTADLRGMHERATSSDDFLPRGVREKPTEPPAHMVQVKDGQVLDVTRLRQNRYRIRLELPAPGKVELFQFWFPGWQASIDGVPISTAPSGPQAVVSCDVPAGDHVVEFNYHGRPDRFSGITVSILTALIGLWAVFNQSLFGRQHESHAA